MSALATMDADVEATQTQVDEETVDYCWSHQEDIDVCADQRPPAEAGALHGPAAISGCGTTLNSLPGAAPG